MSTPKDLSEMNFGRLTAKEIVRYDPKKGTIWRCECSCGREKEVPAAYLLNKKTQSCGCITREIREQSIVKGQRFGLLEAIRFDHTDEKKRTYWLFQCECGNQKVFPVNSVKWSGVRSCGCLAEKHITELNRQDITNERFDRLVAIRPTDQRDASGSVIWECKCDCETIVYYSVNMLRQGRVHSCGCLYNETRQDCVKARRDFKDHTSISSLVAAKKTMKTNTSGYTGVYFDKRSQRWNAYINFKKKRCYLGSYRDIEDAVKAAHAHRPDTPMMWFPKSSEHTLETFRYGCILCGMQHQIGAKDLDWAVRNCREKMREARREKRRVESEEHNTVNESQGE